jgi:hypothetical protein
VQRVDQDRVINGQHDGPLVDRAVGRFRMTSPSGSSRALLPTSTSVQWTFARALRKASVTPAGSFQRSNRDTCATRKLAGPITRHRSVLFQSRFLRMPARFELTRPRANGNEICSPTLFARARPCHARPSSRYYRGSMRRSPRLQDSPADAPRRSPDELASDGDHGHRRPAEVSGSTGVERPPGTEAPACARPERGTCTPPWLAEPCSVPSRQT